tara:strand:- start:3344 stop:4171 length:828 start_codon:yes stop_codon:yes gene_type:complete
MRVPKSDEKTIEERLEALEAQVHDVGAVALAMGTALDALCLELIAEHDFDGDRLGHALVGLSERFATSNPTAEALLLKTAERVRTMHEAQTIGGGPDDPQELGTVLISVNAVIEKYCEAVEAQMRQQGAPPTPLAWALVSTALAGAAGALLDRLVPDKRASAEIFAMQLNQLGYTRFAQVEAGANIGNAMEGAMEASYALFLKPMVTEDGRLDRETLREACGVSIKVSPLLSLSAAETGRNANQLDWLGDGEFVAHVLGLLSEVCIYAQALSSAK